MGDDGGRGTGNGFWAMIPSRGMVTVGLIRYAAELPFAHAPESWELNPHPVPAVV